MPNLIKTGNFAGIPVNDAFAKAAERQSPIIYHLPVISWPSGCCRRHLLLWGAYSPGQMITGPVKAKADVLVVLYTDQETMALLDVFTGNSAWDSAAAKKQWCPYGHNFAKFKGLIRDVNANNALKSGAFGYLIAMKIGSKNVVFYKTELHPKQDGPGMPFVPVMQQLIGELSPKLVVTTGTAGAIGSRMDCGDVAVCTGARLHLQKEYPKYQQMNILSTGDTEISNSVSFDSQYIQYAGTHFTKLSLPGLDQCYQRLQTTPGYTFIGKNTIPCAIYAAGHNPVPGPQPMDIVSADYMTTDDSSNAEHLQTLGIMNDTDDAFLAYAISQMSAGKRPDWISVRNASEPQMEHSPFPDSTSQNSIIDILKDMAGTVYCGIYQYCTTLNSAFAVWGVVAGY